MPLYKRRAWPLWRTMAVITYKCPNCSGPLTWDAKKERYQCEYCRSLFTEAELAALNPDSAEAQKADAPVQAESAQEGQGKDAAGGGQLLVYNCPSCGAQITTDSTTAASMCYYCHNPVVLADRLTGDRQPDLVIPFAIDKKQAGSIFKEWIAQHKYVPRDFYSDRQVEMLSGVYFPYWIFNGKVQGAVEGRGSSVRTWDAGGMRHKETSVYDLSNSGEIEVNNVARIALKKASKVLCESVMPFKPEEAKKFGPGFLQGYVAEGKDVERAEIQPALEDEVKGFALDSIREKTAEGLTDAQFTRADAKVVSSDWKYALMPVWTLTYRERASDKVYYFSINGQTGKTCGELPVDKSALRTLFLKTALPVAAILMLIFYFL